MILVKLPHVVNERVITYNVKKETASSAVTPVTVDHFAYLFNCMPVGQGSGSIMTPT